MLEAHIQHFFYESADLVNQVADILARPVAEAAEAVVGCLTAGGRVLACGQGADADLARWFCAALAWRFERERPGLPALALDARLPGAAPAQALATQLAALGQPGDLLVVFAGLAGDDLGLLTAVAEAHARELSVVLFTGGEPGHWPDALAETDVWIPVAHERAVRVRELHLLAMHALCDAVDLQLLGESEPV